MGNVLKAAGFGTMIGTDEKFAQQRNDLLGK